MTLEKNKALEAIKNCGGESGDYIFFVGEKSDEEWFHSVEGTDNMFCCKSSKNGSHLIAVHWDGNEMWYHSGNPCGDDLFPVY